MSSFKITSYNIQGMFSSAFGEKITNSDFVNIVYSDIIIYLRHGVVQTPNPTLLQTTESYVYHQSNSLMLKTEEIQEES